MSYMTAGKLQAFEAVSYTHLHHVIAEIHARCCAPRLTECDFLPAVIIFQMFALSFRTDELAALGHNPVSYTHLDVYKRQPFSGYGIPPRTCAGRPSSSWPPQA